MTKPALRTSAATTTGLRALNEDAFVRLEDFGFLAVVDGFGGNEASHLISSATHQFVKKFTPESNGKELTEKLFRFLSDAVKTVSKKDVGATITTLRVDSDLSRATIGQVGDCRAYLFREKRLSLLTMDQVRDGVLIGAITPSWSTPPKVVQVPLQRKDTILLCTEGLYESVEEWRLREMLRFVGTSRFPRVDADSVLEKAAAFESNATAAIAHIR